MKALWRRARQAMRAIPPQGRKPLVAIGGGSVLLVGLAMVLLPGPAIVVIPVGLGILATEFAWARRWLRRGRQVADRACQQLKSVGNKTERPAPVAVKKSKS